jgi:hypothetical protein
MATTKEKKAKKEKSSSDKEKQKEDPKKTAEDKAKRELNASRRSSWYERTQEKKVERFSNGKEVRDRQLRRGDMLELSRRGGNQQTSRLALARVRNHLLEEKLFPILKDVDIFLSSTGKHTATAAVFEHVLNKNGTRVAGSTTKKVSSSSSANRKKRTEKKEAPNGKEEKANGKEGGKKRKASSEKQGQGKRKKAKISSNVPEKMDSSADKAKEKDLPETPEAA